MTAARDSGRAGGVRRFVLDPVKTTWSGLCVQWKLTMALARRREEKPCMHARMAPSARAAPMFPRLPPREYRYVVHEADDRARAWRRRDRSVDGGRRGEPELVRLWCNWCAGEVGMTNDAGGGRGSRAGPEPMHARPRQDAAESEGNFACADLDARRGGRARDRCRARGRRLHLWSLHDRMRGIRYSLPATYPRKTAPCAPRARGHRSPRDAHSIALVEVEESRKRSVCRGRRYREPQFRPLGSCRGASSSSPASSLRSVPLPDQPRGKKRSPTPTFHAFAAASHRPGACRVMTCTALLVPRVHGLRRVDALAAGHWMDSHGSAVEEIGRVSFVFDIVSLFIDLAPLNSKYVTSYSYVFYYYSRILEIMWFERSPKMKSLVFQREQFSIVVEASMNKHTVVMHSMDCLSEAKFNLEEYGLTILKDCAIVLRDTEVLVLVLRRLETAVKYQSPFSVFSGAMLNMVLVFHLLFVVNTEEHKSTLFVSVAGFVLDTVYLFLLGLRKSSQKFRCVGLFLMVISMFLFFVCSPILIYLIDLHFHVSKEQPLGALMYVMTVLTVITAGCSSLVDPREGYFLPGIYIRLAYRIGLK
ncbi:B1065G12.31 [Oryza sativa Japonica Group]|uniref:B1065G12.31 protein n=1 Tax=Oryza sativa subsp. japonica TaxID=39947 RepID=Q8RZ64_ORYSJ|nr:B1065G12.31 [Oryza sativa Japonica Group]